VTAMDDPHAAAFRYLSRDDLLDLHAFALERFGGAPGIKSQDRLLAALEAPRQAMFGAELYPDPAAKLAVFIGMLLASRPFVAGNEATALLALLRLLDLNQLTLPPAVDDDDDHLVRRLRQLIAGSLSRDDFAEWLRSNLGALS
jgi:death on curing protein